MEEVNLLKRARSAIDFDYDLMGLSQREAVDEDSFALMDPVGPIVPAFEEPRER